MTRDELDEALLAAHEARNGAAISTLYGKAGDQAEAQGQIDEACFFWVQAYVFALEAGLPSAQEFGAKLKRYGREE